MRLHISSVVSAEVAPYVKVGGLGDVAGSLGIALAKAGNDVRILMPGYREALQKAADVETLTEFPVEIGNRIETCHIKETGLQYKDTEGRQRNLPLYMAASSYYFDRDSVYCNLDDADRFAFFCLAAIKMLPVLNFKPDIIHCNDWHTGPICMLLGEILKKDSFINKKDSFYKGIATVFTVHNLEYQGNFEKSALGLFNIGYDYFTPEKVEFYGKFSFMKAGLVFADVINTVSKTYAYEIKTPEYGERLDGLLRKLSGKLYGIINGINDEYFNPGNDTELYVNYSAGNRDGKKQNKLMLKKYAGFADGDAVLLGIVSRLSAQKGLDLVIDGFDRIMGNNVQFIILGTGNNYYEDAFRRLSDKYAGRARIFSCFDLVLAKKIYAACDIFLMPSKFEPCGLGQLISQRYGTVPVVRATGGLADTVKDFGTRNNDGNGFAFSSFSTGDMLAAIERALKLYFTRPDSWEALIKRIMSLDLSWSKPALEYIGLYKKAVRDHNSIQE